MNKIAAYEMLLKDHPLWEKSANHPLVGATRRSIAKKLGRVASSKNRPAAAEEMLKIFESRGRGRGIHKRMLDSTTGSAVQDFTDHGTVGRSLQSYENTLKRMAKEASDELTLSDHPLWEKTAFSASKLLPAGTALGGSVIGGIGGAMSTKDPEKRKKRALMGAVAGGLTGGLGGEVVRRGKVIGDMGTQVSGLKSQVSGLEHGVRDLGEKLVSAQGDVAVRDAAISGYKRDLRKARQAEDRLFERFDALPPSARNAMTHRVEAPVQFSQDLDYLKGFDTRLGSYEKELAAATDPADKQALQELINDSLNEGVSLTHSLRAHRRNLENSNKLLSGIDMQAVPVPDLPTADAFQSSAIQNLFRP